MKSAAAREASRQHVVVVRAVERRMATSTRPLVNMDARLTSSSALTYT